MISDNFWWILCSLIFIHLFVYVFFYDTNDSLRNGENIPGPQGATTYAAHMPQKCVSAAKCIHWSQFLVN